MLDPVTAVGVRHGVEGALEGVQGLLDGGVADRVDRELVALGVIVVDEVVHLVVAQQHEPRGLGLAEIGLGHRGRAAAGAAVGEDLHRDRPAASRRRRR